MQNLIPAIVGGIVRAAIAAAGGVAVASESDVNQIVGGLSVLAAVVWTIIDKRRTAKAKANETA